MKPIFIFAVALLLLVGCRDKPSEACFHVNELRSNDPFFKFEFTSCSPGAEWFEWDFGDSTVSNEINPEHVYEENGTYTVTLTAYKGAEKTQFSREIQIGPYGLLSYSIESTKLRFELFEDSTLNCKPDLASAMLRVDYAIFPNDSLPQPISNPQPFVDFYIVYYCADSTKKEYTLTTEVPFNLNKIFRYREAEFIDKWTGSKITANIDFGILPEPEPQDTLENDSLTTSIIVVY